MIKKIIKSHLIPRENYLFGFADMKGFVDEKFGNFSYGISVARKLDDNIIDLIKKGPTVEYYDHYNQVNDELLDVSQKIAEDLNRINIQTIVIRPTVTTEELDSIYKETQRTEVSHKMVATRAGLGWIGKTGLLVTKVFGPRLRLTTILTNTVLTPESKPYDMSECGTCRICVKCCPARAANGKSWNILVDRDKFLNANKCREMCAAFGKEALNKESHICGICMAVCPVGIKKMAGKTSGLAN